jgi:hypothetical protein
MMQPLAVLSLHVMPSRNRLGGVGKATAFPLGTVLIFTDFYRIRMLAYWSKKRTLNMYRQLGSNLSIHMSHDHTLPSV